MFGLFQRRRPRGPYIETGLGAVSFRPIEDPGRRGSALVVLHGYGASAVQIETLLPLRLSRPAHILAPEAFVELSDGGRAWFPLRLLDGEATVDPEQLQLALDRLDALLEAVRSQVCDPEGTLTLVGYSQGATLVLEALLSERRLSIDRAAAFAGKPFGPRDCVRSPCPVPVFVANGTRDPVISEADHHQTVDALATAGHEVTERLDPVPHVISRAAARALGEWLDS